MDPIRVRTPFAPALEAPAPAGRPLTSGEPAPRTEPLDVVCTRASLPAPQRSLAGRLLKAAGMGICAAVLGAGTIAGIAYLGNIDAIRQPVSVSQTIQDPPAGPAAIAETTSASPVLASRHALVSAPSPVVVLVPARAVRSLATRVEQSPALRHQIDAKIAATRGRIQQQLEHLPAIDQEALIDVKAPLPTGQRAFLHVGSLDLPSGGLGQFETETVPLTVKAHIQPGAAHVDVEIARVADANVPQGPPGAIYLGSFRTRVMPTEDKVAVDGRVEVTPDLSGNATRAALQTWTQRLAATPADSPQRAVIEGNVARLQARLGDAQRLNAMSPLVQSALHEVLADQGATFHSEIPLDRATPLVEGVHHLWLTAGADGKPDVQVTDSLTTPGIDALRLTHPTVHGLPHAAPAGLLHAPLRAAHAELRERIKSEVREQVDGYSTQLPALVRDVVRSSWAEATPQLRDAVGPQVHAAFTQHDQFTLKLGNPRIPMPLEVKVGTVAPTADGFLAARISLQPGMRGVTGDASRFLKDRGLLPQSVRTDTAFVAVSGDALNAALRDIKQGGSVDWQGMLDDIASQNHLKSLHFNRDAQGRLLTPHITWKNGAAVVEFEMTAEAQGTQPVRAVTGAVAGATGLTDQAARKLAEGLEHSAGTPGKLIGSVVRAPSFLLDQVVGGVKSVVDNTVGSVDRTPEAVTRPVVSLHFSVPLELSTQHGVLSLRPQAQGLELGDATGSTDATVSPANFLQSMIAKAMVASNPEIAQKVRETHLPLDLRAHGIEFTTASVAAPAAGHRAPDFVLGVAPSAQFDISRLAH